MNIRFIGHHFIIAVDRFCIPAADKIEVFSLVRAKDVKLACGQAHLHVWIFGSADTLDKPIETNGLISPYG